MESKRESANSAGFVPEKRNDSSSAVDQKKVSKTDGSSTLMESKRHCPDSRDRKSVIDGDGSSATVHRSDTKNDSSSKPMLYSLRLEDGCNCCFDLRCKDVQFTIDVGTEPVSSLCFKTGNENILYASHGNEIKYFDVYMLSAGSWKPLESYSYNIDEVNQVVCNGRSSFLASADDSGDVKIIDIGQKCLYKTLRAGHTSIWSSVQFIPWRPWEVIIGGFDAKLVLWDFSKGRSQKIIDFDNKPKRSSSGQSLNPVFVHSIADPEIDMVDKLDKICDVARGDGIVDLINVESELSRKGTSKGSSCSSSNSVFKRVRLDYSVGGHKAAVSCVAFFQVQEKGRFLISGGNDIQLKSGIVLDVLIQTATIT